MRIGELSRRTGVNIETIRYYERIRILPEPARSGRYRDYEDKDVRRLRFARRARELGFSLDEVRALLDLSRSDAGACAGARELSAVHLVEVRAKIASLRAMERVLADAIDACDPSGGADCAIIEALSD
ncbi:MAG: MerR family transcriptional regulator [Acidobacteria bacterium]|nr:MerR family transcriptional regulator [Acidobacteriota bacterium]